MALPPFTMIADEDDAPPPPPPIDPAMAEGAITRIRKQVQGNGLKPSSVELRSIKGHIHSFFGTTSVHLLPNIKESKRQGRFNDGQLIQANQIVPATKDFIDKVASDRGVLGLVHETILGRPDNGFGVSGETIPLPQVSRTFLAHEICGKCHGTGGTACHHCHGQKRITCYRCHGQGGIPCVTCQGRGQIMTPQGPVTCHTCQGRGLVQCPVCHGERTIICPECQGQGKKICTSCNGHGWSTLGWAVSLNATTTFKLRTHALPSGLVSLINRVGGAKLAADGHAKITPIMGRDAQYYLQEADIENNAALWFLYKADMPFAELEITMGKSTIRPKLAGFKARLLDVPDFMDGLLKPGLETLADAAKGGATAPQKILECARYRALGDTLRGLVRGSTKRTLKTLTETYTLGLSDTTARKIVKDANTALSRLSLWPRTVAMCMALVFNAGALAAFYLYSLRITLINAILPANPNLWTTLLIDCGYVILLNLLGTYAIRVAAGRASKTVIEGLGVISGGPMPLPKPGAPGLWLWLITIAAAAGFALLSGLIKTLIPLF